MKELNVREMRAAIGLVDEAGEIIVSCYGHAIARILPSALWERASPANAPQARVGAPREGLI